MSAIDVNEGLTPEQIQLREQSHRFAAEVLRPAALALDDLSPEAVIAPESRLWDVFRETYKSGLHLRAFPENLGGAGLSPIDAWVVGEEFGWGNSGLSVSIGVTSMPFRFAALTGNPELMREVVMPYVEDREGRYIGCWCATEPAHGSDLIMYSGERARPEIHLECSARLEGDEWVIQGQKAAWVSNGTIATHTLAFLSVDPSRGMGGMGVAVIPLDLPGVTKGAPLNKLGQRALNQGEIFFDDVRIPRHYMLLDPSMAAAGAGGGMDGILAAANAGMSSNFSGVARAAVEEALTYAEQRIQGGVPLAEHQLVQRQLFEMFTRLEAARSLSRLANRRLMTGKPTIHYSIAAKVLCTQTAFELASQAIQIFGGMGLAKGTLVEMLLRDARASMIEDGANDVLALAGFRALRTEHGGPAGSPGAS
ncbi:MAG: acyl-CoA dehydrogenase family protein [Planctomycetota bacterium]|jgi:alkylation response protein AidB-like acyl-CoA dehydrogenase